MSLAVCPGSFDPITNGHLDIIKRARKLFDQVIVLVSINMEKSPVFSAEERVEMIRRAVQGIPGIEVDSFGGLMVDYVREKGAVAIVKGLRAVSDFENEFQMALINRELMPYAETVFLTTKSEYMFLSSSVVRQVARLGGDITGFVPAPVCGQIMERLNPAGGMRRPSLK